MKWDQNTIKIKKKHLVYQWSIASQMIIQTRNEKVSVDLKI